MSGVRIPLPQPVWVVNKYSEPNDTKYQANTEDVWTGGPNLCQQAKNGVTTIFMFSVSFDIIIDGLM